jgi:hypothetical protein
MQSWKLLQLEPSALREPDNFTAPVQLASNGAHLPAMLFHLANRPSEDGLDGAAIYTEVANRLAQAGLLFGLAHSPFGPLSIGSCVLANSRIAPSIRAQISSAYAIPPSVTSLMFYLQEDHAEQSAAWDIQAARADVIAGVRHIHSSQGLPMGVGPASSQPKLRPLSHAPSQSSLAGNGGGLLHATPAMTPNNAPRRQAVHN